jgi:hypothetical protein
MASAQYQPSLAPSSSTVHSELRHATPHAPADGILPPAFPGNTHKVANAKTGERVRVGTESVRRMSRQRRVRDAPYVCNYPDCGASFTARHNLKGEHSTHA